MKAVITGSNGFIGSSLVATLLEKGSEVRCLVRSEPRTSDDSAHRFVIDYSDPESIIQSGALESADVVFHLAGVTKHLTLEGFRNGNVMPTQSLLEALKKQNPSLQRFVLVSSQAAAGPAPSEFDPVTESQSPVPIEDYGRSKLEAENLLRDSNLPFPYTIIRPAAVYGPRDVDFLPLFKQIKAGRGIYPGNKDSYISLIHVSDLVDGILLASTTAAAANNTYFLTNEVAVTWRHVYKAVASALKKSIWEFNIPFPVIAFAGKLGDLYSTVSGTIPILNSKKIELAKPKYWICSPEKAIQELNFSAQVSMLEGMESTYTWYIDQKWI